MVKYRTVRVDEEIYKQIIEKVGCGSFNRCVKWMLAITKGYTEPELPEDHEDTKLIRTVMGFVNYKYSTIDKRLSQVVDSMAEWEERMRNR
jgi:hypothetical protein